MSFRSSAGGSSSGISGMSSRGGPPLWPMPAGRPFWALVDASVGALDVLLGAKRPPWLSGVSFGHLGCLSGSQSFSSAAAAAPNRQNTSTYETWLPLPHGRLLVPMGRKGGVVPNFAATVRARAAPSGDRRWSPVRSSAVWASPSRPAVRCRAAQFRASPMGRGLGKRAAANGARRRSGASASRTR